ncbi:efflux RND transporter permease subunit [Solimicrobium silvestre]|uniref:Heavy metal efflux pump, CzcA family n=1 Tax=Solimicrobium silvestre TaxID=2099400 RepID=A0A2S9GWC1_9BURK|nr:CusA/CzcA family heavy metal efflux RND transporter [Solimicrobium silvestre]PRC91956.1 Heavy metal efflux pump, CzcA family [Solimicrobium silvestre]
MNSIVAFSLKQRLLVVILLVALFALGTVGFIKLNIEAYPDPVPPLVDIITQSTGQSAEEIERYVTIPIEVQLAGIPHVTTVRTISLFGLSDVKVQFTYDYSYQEAEQQVINRLSQLAPLPNGAAPQISPTSPTGEIFRYRVVGPPGYSVMDLKTIEDWMLERRFKAVPGVVDVNGWGGKTKDYEVSIDMAKLMRYGLTVPQVLQVLNNSNINVGGQTVNFGAQAAVVRGVGMIHSLDNIRNTMVASLAGTPVLISDIATVSVGNVPRLGIAGNNADNDIVQGIVLMRRGEQSTPTILRVEQEVDKINHSGILPPGVHIEKIYDRSELIAITTHTVLENLVVGIALIFLVQWIFLGNLRSAVIVSATIPFALFFAIGIMTMRGESANLLSVGAIDFGLIVDATVIMVENVFRHLAESQAQRSLGSPMQHYTRSDTSLRGKFLTIAHAAAEVNRPIFFSAAIIIAGFLPLFTLSGVEGHIFGPMAKTYAYAIVGGLIATFTVSPALCALLLPEHVDETETFLVRWMRRIYTPVMEFAIVNRALILSGMAVLGLIAVIAVHTLGLEFLPKLEEGNLWIRASMPDSISLEEGNAYVNQMRLLIKSYPEVDSIVSQNGRPDDGTDASGFFNAEFFVPMKPSSSWPKGITKEKLTEDMSAKLQEKFPGVEFNFSQYIEDNVEEAASGVKGQNSVKLYGNDLAALEKSAAQIKAVMATVPGIADLSVFNALGQPTVKIDIDRVRAARYGLQPGDINATVQAAIGGQAAGNLYEEGSDRNFPIVVRLASQYRQNLDSIGRITIGAQNPNGSGVVQIPLSDVASVNLVSGASFIYREGQERYIPIKFSVRGRDLGGAVQEAQRKVAEQVKLPGGYRMEWVGEFGQLEDAMARLKIVVPLSLALIMLLLYFNFNSITDTLLAASVMPMALIGGIFALYVTGTPFSVSAAIGFIGLFGISVMEGIIVLSYYNQLIESGTERAHAIVQSCQTRLRPVMMTCSAACAGLLPAAFATGIGSQVQKPLALVVVGGILLAPVLILLVLPVLIQLFSKRTPFVDKQEKINLLNRTETPI